MTIVEKTTSGNSAVARNTPEVNAAQGDATSAGKSQKSARLRTLLKEYDPQASDARDKQKEIIALMSELRAGYLSRTWTNEDKADINKLFNDTNALFSQISANTIIDGNNGRTKESIKTNIELISNSITFAEQTYGGDVSVRHASSFDEVDFGYAAKQELSANFDENVTKTNSLLEQLEQASRFGDTEKVADIERQLDYYDRERGDLYAQAESLGVVGMIDANAKAIIQTAAANYDEATKVARSMIDGTYEDKSIYVDEDPSKGLTQQGSFKVQQLLMDAQLMLSLANTIIRIASSVANKSTQPLMQA